MEAHIIAFSSTNFARYHHVHKCVRSFLDGAPRGRSTPEGLTSDPHGTSGGRKKKEARANGKERFAHGRIYYYAGETQHVYTPTVRDRFSS